MLEIGGGIGSFHLELLLRSAARATNVELSDAYEREAAALVAEAGVADRVERRTADIAVAPDAVDAADVVLHRVVCCYPDHRALLMSAADRARRLLVFSHPRSGPIARLVSTGENAMHWLRGREFRTFVHSPSTPARQCLGSGREGAGGVRRAHCSCGCYGVVRGLRLGRGRHGAHPAHMRASNGRRRPGTIGAVRAGETACRNDRRRSGTGRR